MMSEPTSQLERLAKTQAARITELEQTLRDCNGALAEATKQRADLDRLLTARHHKVMRLRAQLADAQEREERLRGELEWYADESRYDNDIDIPRGDGTHDQSCSILEDKGFRARTALSIAALTPPPAEAETPSEWAIRKMQEQGVKFPPPAAEQPIDTNHPRGSFGHCDAEVCGSTGWPPPAKPCPVCGAEMPFEEGDTGDRMTPPTPSAWACECGHTEEWGQHPEQPGGEGNREMSVPGEPCWCGDYPAGACDGCNKYKPVKRHPDPRDAVVDLARQALEQSDTKGFIGWDKLDRLRELLKALPAPAPAKGGGE